MSKTANAILQLNGKATSNQKTLQKEFAQPSAQTLRGNPHEFQRTGQLL